MNDDLIINENVLLPEYVPDSLPGRRNEIEDIAYTFRLALNGRKADNLLVHGPPGTGKTAVVKHIIKEIGDTHKLKIVYINCWHTGTRYNILNEILRKLGYLMARKGLSIEEMTERIVNIAKNNGFSIIVVLDEMDRLIASGHGDVLYDLSRMNETFGINLSVIGIVNDFELITTLDPRIRSSYINRDIEFKPYDVPTLKRILLERAKIAFANYDDEAIGLCAAYAYKRGGDARVAINLLLQAGRIAERKGKRILDVESVEEANKGFMGSKIDKAEVELSEIEKKIVEILKEKGEVKSGELYKMFDVSDRTIRNYLKRLEENGIIETYMVASKGKTRVIRLKP